MHFLKKYISIVDKINNITGNIAAWLSFVLVLLVCFDVFTRYFLQFSSVAVQELEWHLFAVIFLLGAAYTLKIDGHVKVDIIYSKLSIKSQAWINIMGVLLLFIPFCLVILYASENFVVNSFLIGEKSPDPGGLPARYILKSFLPISFVFLLLQGIALLFKSVIVLTNKDAD